MWTKVAVILGLVCGIDWAGDITIKDVTPSGTKIAMRPAVEVLGLSVRECLVKDTGASKTLVTGFLVSHLPKQSFAITVTIDLVRICGTGVEIMGMAEATIREPGPGAKVPFVCVGPECIINDKNKRWYASIMRIQIEPLGH